MNTHRLPSSSPVQGLILQERAAKRKLELIKNLIVTHDWKVKAGGTPVKVGGRILSLPTTMAMQLRIIDQALMSGRPCSIALKIISKLAVDACKTKNIMRNQDTKEFYKHLGDRSATYSKINYKKRAEDKTLAEKSFECMEVLTDLTNQVQEYAEHLKEAAPSFACVIPTAVLSILDPHANLQLLTYKLQKIHEKTCKLNAKCTKTFEDGISELLKQKFHSDDFKTKGPSFQTEFTWKQGTDLLRSIKNKLSTAVDSIELSAYRDQFQQIVNSMEIKGAPVESCTQIRDAFNALYAQQEIAKSQATSLSYWDIFTDIVGLTSAGAKAFEKLSDIHNRGITAIESIPTCKEDIRDLLTSGMISKLSQSSSPAAETVKIDIEEVSEKSKKVADDFGIKLDRESPNERLSPRDIQQAVELIQEAVIKLGSKIDNINGQMTSYQLVEACKKSLTTPLKLAGTTVHAIDLVNSVHILSSFTLAASAHLPPMYIIKVFLSAAKAIKKQRDYTDFINNRNRNIQSSQNHVDAFRINVHNFFFHQHKTHSSSQTPAITPMMKCQQPLVN